jgi:hypothetical protein
MRRIKVMCNHCNLNDPASISNYREDVWLPEGWRRVWTGAVKPGDKFLNAQEFKKGVGIVIWLDAEQAKGDDYYKTAENYLCLIRKDDAEVEAACERCEVYVRASGLRFCRDCATIIVAAARKRGK